MPYRFMARLMLGLALIGSTSAASAGESTRKPGLGVSLAESVYKVAPGEYTQVTLALALDGLEGPVRVSLMPRDGLQLAGNLERTLKGAGAQLPLSVKAPGPGRYQLTLHFVAPEQGGLNRRTLVAVFDAGGEPQKAAARSDSPYTVLPARERIEPSDP